jgi:hypothetical protein
VRKSTANGRFDEIRGKERKRYGHVDLASGAALTRLAILSALDVELFVSSSTRRRPRAIDATNVARFSVTKRRQVVADPGSTDVVAFGSKVTFKRADGRVQTYRIVGEDEADPNAGSISFVSPIARLLLGKAVGDEVHASGQDAEIVAIS